MADDDRDDMAGKGQVIGDEELDEIRNSLHKPGFLLEHRTFETLQGHGLNSFLGHYYEDGDTGREIDLATRDNLENKAGVALWSSVVVECKNWDAPLVIIGRKRSHLWRGRTFSEASMSGDPLADSSSGRKDDFSSSVVFLRLRDLPKSIESADFFGSQMVLLERRGSGFAANNKGVFESALLPLAKAAFSEQRSLRGAG